MISMKRDIGREEVDKLLAETEKELRDEYRQAHREVTAKCRAFFQQFIQAEREKRRELRMGEISPQEFNRWRASYMLDLQRWQNCCDDLAADYTNANQIAMSIVRGHLPDVYAISINYGTYDVERQSLIDTSWTLYNRQAVERLVRDHPSLLPDPTVDIPKDMRWNRNHINSAVIQGILQGDDILDISKRLRSVTGMNQRAALRNARTAFTSAENGGRNDASRRARQMGIQFDDIWISTLDSRTRYSHRQLDGERKSGTACFSNGLMYPGDPAGEPEEVYNCRCALGRVYVGLDYDPETVERHNALGSMTYRQWKNTHPDYKGLSEQWDIDHPDYWD